MSEPELPPGAERIGPLVFVPMDEPPGDEFARKVRYEQPPRFWMEEQTGALGAAVETYLDGQRLDVVQLELIRIYLQQYVERALLTGDANRGHLLGRVAKLRTNHEIEELADALAEYGAEVF